MFEIKGLDKLSSALATMGEKAIPIIETAVDNSGNVVLKRAQQKAKGNLKNSMELKKAKNTSGQIYSQVAIKKGYAYAAPVELGHNLTAWGNKTNIHIKEQPFLRPAADESVDEVEKIVSDAMNKILDEFGG